MVPFIPIALPIPPQVCFYGAVGPLRLDFDRRLMRQFRGSTITSDAEPRSSCGDRCLDILSLIAQLRAPPTPA
jgi:hypothetical protein